MPAQLPKIQPLSTTEMPWEEYTDIPNFTTRYKHLTRAALGNDYHVGLAIEELPPGKQSSPFHYHIFEEEHLFILEGSVTLRLGKARYEMSLGDYVCFPAGKKVGHCLINNQSAPCRYIVIGERNPNEIAVYPDSNKVLIRGLDRTILDLSARRRYWDGEATGLDPDELPPISPATNVQELISAHPPINADHIAWEESVIDARFGGQAKHLTRHAIGKDYRVGVMIEAPRPGQRLAPLHYHMVEEEQALILEGDVRLLLEDKSYDLKSGDYVCFPAGVKTGHSFMNIGNGPCRYLMIGEKNPHDVCVYPTSHKLAVNALRQEADIFDMTAQRRYWDGETEC